MWPATCAVHVRAPAPAASPFGDVLMFGLDPVGASVVCGVTYRGEHGEADDSMLMLESFLRPRSSATTATVAPDP